MLDTRDLEMLLYQGKFEEVSERMEEWEERDPGDFFLSVFRSRYFEMRGDYDKALSLAHNNWEKALVSGNTEWIIPASVPLLDMYHWRKLWNFTHYFQIAHHVAQLDYDITQNLDPEYLKYIGLYLTLANYYSNIVIRQKTDYLADLEAAEEIFAGLDFPPGLAWIQLVRARVMDDFSPERVTRLEQAAQMIENHNLITLECWYLFIKKDMYHVRESSLVSEKTLLNKALEIADGLDNQILHHLMIKNWIGTFQDRQAFDLVKSYADQLVEFGISQNQPNISSIAYDRLVNYYFVKEDRSKTIDAMENRVYYLKESGDFEITDLYSRFVHLHLHRQRGEYDLALEKIQANSRDITEFKEKHGLEQTAEEIWWVLGPSITIYRVKGDYQKAIALDLETEEMRKTRGASHELGHVYSRVSTNFLRMGELDQATTYATKALETFQYLESKAELHALRSLGNIEQSKGNFRQALDYYNLSLEAADKTSSFYELNIYKEMVPCLLMSGRPERAREILETMKAQESEHTGRTDVWSWVRLSEALIYKQSKRVSDQVRAMELLKSILSREGIRAEEQIVARTHLAELIFYELKLHHEESTYEELKGHLDILAETAQDNFLYPTLVDVLIIKSRIALVDLDLERSLRLLSQANLMCDEKGMIRLGEKVEREISAVNSEAEKWTSFSRKNPSLMERVQQSNLSSYFQKAKAMISEMEADDF